jgi:hypothetical protein
MEKVDLATQDRHPSTKHIMQFFNHGEHLTDPKMREISELCSELAWDIFAELHDDPELTDGLRHLLKAKDCFLRAEISHRAQQK